MKSLYHAVPLLYSGAPFSCTKQYAALAKAASLKQPTKAYRSLILAESVLLILSQMDNVDSAANLSVKCTCSGSGEAQARAKETQCYCQKAMAGVEGQ